MVTLWSHPQGVEGLESALVRPAAREHAKDSDRSSGRVPCEADAPVADAEPVLGWLDAAKARDLATTLPREEVERSAHTPAGRRIESVEVTCGRPGEDQPVAVLSARPRPPRR